MDLLQTVRDLARRAHDGQIDKRGRDYFEGHLSGVAGRLADHGPEAEMVGWLHDIIEDTEVTAADLTDLGVPDRVVTAVVAISRRVGDEYGEYIDRAAADPLARLVKLADTADNLSGIDDLARTDPQPAQRLRERYLLAREVLLAADAGDGSADR